MEGLQIDSCYIAHKLIQRLYEEGKINKATYDNVLTTYPPAPGSAACRPGQKEKEAALKNTRLYISQTKTNTLQ